MNKPEEREVNFDCIHIFNNQRACRALNRLYCKTEECSFYKTHDDSKLIPHIILNNKVYRVKDTLQ